MPSVRDFLLPFVALRHRNYRLLWTGSLISNTGSWVDQIALNWLVLQSTGSPAMLGLMNLCRGIPVLVFTLVGGAMADRAERRSLMVATQLSAMTVAALLAALVFFENANIWFICAVAILRGTIVSFNLPARHSLVSELVPREDLARAIALNSMTLNLTKVIGPLVAGVLIATVGLGVCFLVNALTFIPVIYCLLAMRFPPSKREISGRSIGGDIVSGFAFIRRDEAIRLLVLVAIIPTFFAQPYIAMLAVFATDVYRVGPGELGILTASAAVGAILGGLLVSTFANLATRGLTMLLLLFLYGAAIIAFSANGTFALAPVLLFCVGASHIAYNACNNTILQMIVPDHMRGRVLSTLFLNKSLVSFGTAMIAALSVLVGPQWSMGLSGAVVCLSAAILFAASPVMRHLKA